MQSANVVIPFYSSYGTTHKLAEAVSDGADDATIQNVGRSRQGDRLPARADIDPADLRIDVFRASGAGGQHVNKTESAVRITHEPSGVVVSCQDEKSQHKNKDKAMRVLRSRLYERERERREQERSEARRNQVGSGDRSAKIRTYNFPQGRVTDHRIGMSVQNLSAVMDGELDEFINEYLLSISASDKTE